MHPSLPLTVLAALLLSGCDIGRGTDPSDKVPIGFGAIEGVATFAGSRLADAPIDYSCGPGLFGGTTRTDTAGEYRIALRFPDTLRAKLPSDRRLGCLVQIPRDWRGLTPFYGLAVPVLTFAEVESNAHPVRADILMDYPAAYVYHTARDNVHFDLHVGEEETLRPFSGCFKGCAYFGVPVHPEVATVMSSYAGPGASLISIAPTALGTTTILVYGVRTKEQVYPDGWRMQVDTSLVGAFGVTVNP